MAITIKKVSTKRELKKFIRFNYNAVGRENCVPGELTGKNKKL